MSRLLLIGCLIASAGVAASAQDPTKTLPEAYRVQLDNDHVQVVRVHYAAGVKLADHTHAAGTTVYVYLNDSDGVVFRHSGRSTSAVTRPPVKAGGVRVASGGEEHHTAENPAATPSDFLRILLKKGGAGPRTVRRLSPADMEFENTQLRLRRFNVTGDTPQQIDAAAHAALMIALPSGDTQWLAAGTAPTLPPGHYLRLELL